MHVYPAVSVFEPPSAVEAYARYMRGDPDDLHALDRILSAAVMQIDTRNSSASFARTVLCVEALERYRDGTGGFMPPGVLVTTLDVQSGTHERYRAMQQNPGPGVVMHDSAQFVHSESYEGRQIDAWLMKTPWGERCDYVPHNIPFQVVSLEHLPTRELRCIGGLRYEYLL